MRIERETFLSDLNTVKAGLSPREFIEQSSCFVFQDEYVMTFNDEVACRKKIGLDITGAIQAASLLAILEKMDDPELMVEENDKGELEFKGKRKSFAVTKDAEIFLPVDKVETPEKWRELPKEFTEAVGLVQHCVSTDESRFLLTCIHLHPDYIEACDNLQVMRCQIKTGLKDSVLVRGTSLAHIVSLGMDKIALTKAWIHFRNQQGLVFSCRRYAEDYPSLDKVIHCKGHPMVIPKGLAQASERAAIFAVDKAGDALVSVTIKEGRIRIVGEGLSGWFKEVKKVNYSGPPMQFFIAPELLKYVSEKYKNAQITEDKLKVVGGSWEYATVLGKPRSEEDEASEEDEE
jgi:DNA polymerase III sliding clamp (beta) subunit (PCNA family)